MDEKILSEQELEQISGGGGLRLNIGTAAQSAFMLAQKLYASGVKDSKDIKDAVESYLSENNVDDSSKFGRQVEDFIKELGSKTVGI